LQHIKLTECGTERLDMWQRGELDAAGLQRQVLGRRKLRPAASEEAALQLEDTGGVLEQVKGPGAVLRNRKQLCCNRSMMMNNCR
jgi:hypothetical protein